MKTSLIRRIPHLALGVSLLAALSLAQLAHAQTDAHPNTFPAGQALDTPQPPARDLSPSVTPTESTASPSTLPEAPRTQRYPKPGQPAPVLTPADKLHMAMHGAFSPFAATGWMFAAGYEQLTNSNPNWGSDRGAFGQRLGSAAIRGTSEGLLSNAAMASLFHMDPRYYRLGRGHKPLARVLYAATRPLISRTDGGRTVPNFSLMAGNLAGSALTNLYYPSQNRGVAQTFATFGGGLGGSALGFGIAEFFGGILFDHNWHR